MFTSFIELLLSRIVRDNNGLQSVLRDISFIPFYHQPSSSPFPFSLQFSSFPGLLYVMYICESLNENCLCHITLLNGMSTAKIKILSNKWFIFSVLCVLDAWPASQIAFVSYWVFKFCKLLGVSGKRLSQLPLCCLLTLVCLLTGAKICISAPGKRPCLNGKRQNLPNVIISKDI